MSLLHPPVLQSSTKEYLWERGGHEDDWTALGLATFDHTILTPTENFNAQFKRPQDMDGRLVIPHHAPSGDVVRWEFRDIVNKDVNKHTLDKAEWTPSFIGLPLAVEAFQSYTSSTVWLVEGLFDLFALRWLLRDHPRHVVLATGTAKLSSTQARFLTRVRPFLVNVVFDQDQPGHNGTHGYIDPTGKKVWGALSKLEREGIHCRALAYAERKGDDPGLLWDRGGRALIEKQLGPYI